MEIIILVLLLIVYVLIGIVLYILTFYTPFETRRPKSSLIIFWPFCLIKHLWNVMIGKFHRKG